MYQSVKVAVLLMSLIPCVVIAQNCGDLQTQAEMNQCAAETYAKIDGDLNRAYYDYRTRLSEDQERQLRDAQLAWIKFRDLSCRFETSGVEGGSIYPLILNSCLASMTGERLRQISVLANCKEGDPGCASWH